LNLTSKGVIINTKFIDLGLTRHLCNLIQNNVSDQRVVPLSLMIFSNLVTYNEFSNRIFNDSIDTVRRIHDMTYLKMKKDTKYHQDEDKIFNKVFFLLSYSRLSLNFLLQSLMNNIDAKINIEKYFEVFLEIFLNVELAQNNLLLITGRIIYFMIFNSEKLYDFLLKRDTFFKRLIQIVAGDDFELVMKGKLDHFSNGEITKDKVAGLIAGYLPKTSTNYDSPNDRQRSMSPVRSEDEEYALAKAAVIQGTVIFNEKEKAASQSRMIAFLLLRLISKKEKNSKIFFIYRGLDHLIKYIYRLFQTAKITDEERESIILFYSNIISSKAIQEKLNERLRYVIKNFQSSFNPRSPDPILIACLQFFLHLSKFSDHHKDIAKRDFLTNVAVIYRRPEPSSLINKLIQILLSNLSFSDKTHNFIIRSGCHKIVEKVDETNEHLKQFINISKLNMALNYKTFIELQMNPGVLTSLPLMNAINPVGQIRLYKAALQYLIKEGPDFMDIAAIPEGMFHEFSDPKKDKVNIFSSLSQGSLNPSDKKKYIVYVLTTCFSNLIESMTNQSVYIIKRVIYITLILLDHPYLSDVKVNVPSLLSNVISIAYSFPDTVTRTQSHQIITKVQMFDFFFHDNLDYKDTMESWFSKCTKVLMNIHKIEDDNCRGYIFEYFFKFLSYRFSRQPINASIRSWAITSKFDLLVYLLFVKRKFLNQDLFDHMSECLANCFLVQEILDKFDVFLLLNYFEALYGNMKACRPLSIAYLVGILYAILQKMNYDLVEAAEKQMMYTRTKAVESMHDFNDDNNHNRLFVPITANNKEKTKTKKVDTQANNYKDDQMVDKSIHDHSNSLITPPPTRVRDMLKNHKMSVVSGVINNGDQIIGGKETFEIFEINQAILNDKIQKNRSGLVSIVLFTLKVLRHCLRYINYKELKPVFDFKSKTKERELFRYLHLIVDLSSNTSNHPIVMHPIFIRNVLSFVLQSESENLMHYHRIFDCSLPFN
jgi:hypothetical protein